jgi:hypothetical protein
MPLLTYLFAAALLWAVAVTGPATPDTSAAPAPPTDAARTPPPRPPAPTYPR